MFLGTSLCKRQVCGLIESLHPTRLPGERRLGERQQEACGGSWASPVEVTLKIGAVLMLLKVVTWIV